jgi:hypothetical protein
MKKQLTALTLAAALCGISSPAFANLDQPTEKTQPVKMTAQQLDDVTAGALVKVVTNLRNVRNTDVDIDVDTTILNLSSSKGKKHDMKKHDMKKHDGKKHDGKRRH